MARYSVESAGQVFPEGGIRRRRRDGALEEFDGRCRIAGAQPDETQGVQRIGILGITRQNVGGQRLGLGQPPGMGRVHRSGGHHRSVLFAQATGAHL